MENMAEEKRYYIDATELRNLIMNLQNSTGVYYSTDFYSPSPIDQALDTKFRNFASNINATLSMVLHSLAASIDAAKRPYTQCMLCNDINMPTPEGLED